ncbi:hypothetical protein BC830DRAFT_542866 [Chytriomyces sp. MP71]|nr:hypothetical protein BC830DRAFT_542866 [Chytriomyces sp. MP71]
MEESVEEENGGIGRRGRPFKCCRSSFARKTQVKGTTSTLPPRTLGSTNVASPLTRHSRLTCGKTPAQGNGVTCLQTRSISIFVHVSLTRLLFSTINTQHSSHHHRHATAKPLLPNRLISQSLYAVAPSVTSSTASTPPHFFSSPRTRRVAAYPQQHGTRM